MLIEIAGVPLEVNCRYAENERFFREYETHQLPFFSIAPTDEDLKRMQVNHFTLAQAEGRPKQIHSDAFLENNAIHALLAEKLVEYDVLLMHGSALCMDGVAYLFTAPSGTGKSTHTRLWREVFGDRVWMINDDKPMLRISDNGVTVYGTPWNGKHHISRNASAPLKAIVLLNRGKENRIEPMSKADAFTVVMKQALTSKIPSVMMKIIQLENNLLNAVDFYQLSCNMEPEAARVAWQRISSGSSERKEQ